MILLRDFISSALADIVGGVVEAQKALPAGTVVPGHLKNDMSLVVAGVSELQSIDFEITVRADEKSGREGGLSVVSAVLGVGAGMKTKVGKSGGHDATLRFKIPVLLPKSHASK